MLYMITMMVFSIILMMLYATTRLLFKNHLIISERLEKVKISEKNNFNQREQDINSRSFDKLLAAMSKRLAKFTPVSKIEKLNTQLESAGFSNKYNASSWILLRNVSSFTIAGFISWLIFLLKGNLSESAMFFIFLVMVIRFILRFQLLSRIEKNKKDILKALPFTLDLITVSVEAGLSFDGALTRVISTVESELSREFSKTLKEMRMGIERKVALKNLSNRCGVRELSNLVTSLVQADELGVSLGKVLRIQADHLRENRKQKAREKAMKVPVKMLIPLILFIFPTVFVIILGPALIQVFQIFS